MYLGMSGRTPSINHSDFILFKVKLPGVKLSEITIDIQKRVVEVLCPQFRLKVYLACDVKEDGGSAKWSKDIQELNLSLVIQKEIYNDF